MLSKRCKKQFFIKLIEVILTFHIISSHIPKIMSQIRKSKQLCNFKASTLLNKNIIIIDSKIKIFDQNLNENFFIFPLNNSQIISTSLDAGLTTINSINGFESNFHIIFSNFYVYVLSYTGELMNTLYFNITDGYNAIFLSYQFTNIYYCFIIYINIDYKLYLSKYTYSIKQNSKQKINETVYNSPNINNYKVASVMSCQVMSKNNSNFIVCFLNVVRVNDTLIISAIYDLNLELKSEEIIEKNCYAIYIKSVLSLDKSKAFVCYIIEAKVYCLIYDLIKNFYSKKKLFIENCDAALSLFGLDYYEDIKEYVLYCYSDNKFNFFRFDLDFKEKTKDKEKSCIFEVRDCSIVDSSLIYLTKKKKYFIMYNCGSENKEFKELQYKCQPEIEDNNIKEENEEIEENEEEEIQEKEEKKEIKELENIEKKEEKEENKKTEENEEIEKYEEENCKQEKEKYKEKLEEIKEMEEEKYEKKSDNLEIKIIINNTDIPKDVLINKLDELMKNIEDDVIYKYIGDDYNLTIAQSDKFNKKETNIELLNCENILKEKYQLKDTELTIVQLEIDKKSEKAVTNQVEYEVYNNRKEKLDLSYCKNSNIKVNYEIKNTSLLDIPTIFKFSEEGIDLLNINDDFFNDICFPYYINKTDITLKDRVEDYYQNYSSCDSDCTYENIDIDKKIITCICKVKTEMNKEIEPLTFAQAFRETFKKSNYFVIKCYNLVFDFSNKSSNLGFWILLFLTVAHIPLIIHYFIKGIKPIQSFVLNEMILNNYITNTSNPIKKKNKKEIKIQNINENSSSEYNMNSNILKSKGVKEFFTYTNDLNRKESENKKSKKKKKTKSIHNNKKKENNMKKIKKNIPKNNYYSLIRRNANNTGKKIQPKSNYILNIYEFQDAIKYDDRSFWRLLYISLLYNENILYALVFNSPLEIRTLRICLVIFNYTCSLALNALFYTNEKISKRYHYDGENLELFTFVHNITASFFSAFLNFLITLILKIIINPRRELEKIFRKEEEKLRKNKKYVVSEEKKKNIQLTIKRIYFHMKVKNFIFIIVEFSFMLLCCYFITSFCCVYIKTQISWILKWVSSFVFSIFLEFAISMAIASLYRSAVYYKFQLLYNIVILVYSIC